jgi:hypothetical protein
LKTGIFLQGSQKSIISTPENSDDTHIHMNDRKTAPLPTGKSSEYQLQSGRMEAPPAKIPQSGGIAREPVGSTMLQREANASPGSCTGSATMTYYILGFLLFEALWFLPFRKVFMAAHFSAHYAWLALIPLVGPLLCIWILAARPWPLKTKLVRTFSHA